MQQNSQPRSIPAFGWVLIFAVAAIFITIAAFFFRKSERCAPCKEPVIAAVPDFSFTTQEGKTFTRADLAGKIWIADFIFTSCMGPCPMMTARMLEISSKLAKNPDVKLVSVTVDPEHDTPEVLAKYAANIHADPHQWFFLTGPFKEIASFSQQGLKQPLALEAGSKPNHSTRLIIVDRNGMIRYCPDGNDPEVVQKALIIIGDLLREQPTPKK